MTRPVLFAALLLLGPILPLAGCDGAADAPPAAEPATPDVPVEYDPDNPEAGNASTVG